MRRLPTASIGVLGAILLATPAGAVNVVSYNLPHSTDANGATWGYGSWFNDQGSSVTMGTRIHLAADSNISLLTFWGYAQFGPPGGFRAKILSDDFSTTLADQSWNMSQVAVQNTGYADTQYAVQLDSGQGFQLAAGDYWLAIGAMGSGASEFHWVLGESTQPNNLAYRQGSASSQWNVATGTNHTLAYMLLGNQVPAPGALAAIAMLGAMGTRRRRAH